MSVCVCILRSVCKMNVFVQSGLCVKYGMQLCVCGVYTYLQDCGVHVCVFTYEC